MNPDAGKATSFAMSVIWSVEGSSGMPGNGSETENFLQDLAHDLRQPLGDIEMIAYHLQTGASVDPAQAREMLGRIRLLVEETNEILSRSLRQSARAASAFDETEVTLTGLRVPPAGA